VDKFRDNLDGKDYAFYETLDGILSTCAKHIDAAGNEENEVRAVINLKMAQRAIECALEIYGDRVAEMQKEKK
jgi:hypothetical protein